jgi:hypothetical protein
MMEPGLWFPVGSRYRDGRAGANGGVEREHAASGSTSAGILTPAYIVGWREPGPHEHLDSVGSWGVPKPRVHLVVPVPLQIWFM